MNNSCGRFQSRQVVVNSLPHADCDKGGIRCLESSAMKIALVWAITRLKKHYLGMDPNRNLGSEKCFLPLTPCVNWDLNFNVFSIKSGL